MSSSRFDNAALTWDEKPRRVAIAQGIAEAILRQVPLDDETELVDYGCGTGLLGLMLRPYVARVTGMDSSHGMLSVMKEKIKKMGLTGAQALYCDLEKEEGLEEASTDLIVSAMVMHHIADVGHMIKKFHLALRAGGHLAIGDLLTEEGSFHEHGNDGVKHFGFSLAQMERWFADAGFVEIQSTIAHTVKKENGREYPIFVVSGRRI